MILNGEAKLKTIMGNDGTQANPKKPKENDKNQNLDKVNYSLLEA